MKNHLRVLLALAPLTLGAQTLETDDGLALTLGDGALRVGSTALGDGVTFRAVDFRTGETEEGARAADGLWIFPDLGLSLTTTWTAESDHLRFAGSLINTRAATDPERAVTLTMGLSVDPTLPGLAWDNDIRTSRPVTVGETYQNTMPSRAGAEHFVARYPLVCVRGEGWGLALANPIDEPHIERLLFDATRGELAIAWDLGVSPITEHFPGRADVTALVFRTDAAWGFRDAWRRFMALHPDAFTVRQQRQGNWMPFTQIDRVERPEDFDFGVHEYHLDVSIDWNEQHGVASMIYTEPVVHWLDMPAGMERTYEQYMAHLRRQISPKASSLITSGCFGPDQLFTHGFFEFPWANGARTPTNPDPEVATTPRAPNNRFDEDWAVIANALGWNGSGLLHSDGAYFDSFEGWDMDQLNYRRDHWRTVDWPLTFDSEGRLAYPDMFHAFEFAAEVARRLRPEGMLTMANTVPYRFVWSTAWLDILGIETSWGVGEDLTPPPSEELDWIRTLCGAKPYCWLQNVPYEQFRGAKVTGYFERNLFFGFYPSFFSHDAANDPYWEDPALYNEDRSVFLRHMPAIRRVGEAGWQPVTHARADHPDVQIERFGEGDAFYLTLFNAGDLPAEAAVTFDAALASDWAVWDLLSLEIAPLDAATGAFALTLPGEGVRALRVQRMTSNALAVAGDEMVARLAALEALVADPSRAGHEAEYAESLARARGEAELVAGLGAERAAAVDVAVEALSVASPGADLAVRVSPSGSGTASLLHRGEVLAETSFTDREFTLAVPDTVDFGETLSLRVNFAAPIATTRWLALPVVFPLELHGLPWRVVFRDERTLDLEIANNTGETQIIGLTLMPPEGLLAEPAAHETTLTMGERESLTVTLRPAAPVVSEWSGEMGMGLLCSTFAMDGVVLFTLLDPGASLARDDNVTVEVDSAYSSYTAAPLRDGITDTAEVAWSEAAWASGESFEPHWVLIRFPSLTEVREVKVWWALDGGELWSSARHRGEVQTPAGEWVEVGAIENETPREFDHHSFDPIMAQAVRVIQPAGGGPVGRESLMWLSEVEVR